MFRVGLLASGNVAHTRYGNHISLIDATYRTMKYELPLFFVCARTNVGYSVVAQFIVQSESVECISEALAVLKEWNSNWTPPYFLVIFLMLNSLHCNRHFPVQSCTAVTSTGNRHGHGGHRIERMPWIEKMPTVSWTYCVLVPGHHQELGIHQLIRTTFRL